MASRHTTSRNTAPPPAVAAAAAARAEEETEEDLNASPPGLWLPRTVVKRHRKEATAIWVSLLVAFFGYVGYIVSETIKARNNPAASITVKQEHFKFPDVAVCPTFLAGCLTKSVYCFEDNNFTFVDQRGFMEEASEFDTADYPEVAKIREAYPSCAVMPLSRLTVNETGVNNGDITSFLAAFNIMWDEDPLGDFNATEHPFHTQSVNVNFIDIDQDLEEIGENILDARVPYDRLLFTKDEWFAATQNNMVVTLSEFSGITSTGKRKEAEQTFFQSTTSGKLNRYWTEPSATDVVAFLHIEMTIAKFEYTSIAEVDPVDGWTIIGAIGGVWQIVVIAFGVFFVFSEKQPPDMKMRNFYEVISTPVINIKNRVTGVKSRPPQQVAHNSQTSGSGAPNAANEPSDGQGSKGGHLPPGWIARTDDDGIIYYLDTVAKSTQWERPTWRVHSNGGGGVGVEAVDAPMAHTRRGFSSPSERASNSTAALPGTASEYRAAHPVANVQVGASSVSHGVVTDGSRWVASGASSMVPTGDVENERPPPNRAAVIHSPI